VLPDFSARRLEPEVMDEPDLDPARHRRALDALARVNALSLTAGRAWREVIALARAGVRPVRVLDVACGGGDVLVALSRKAARAGVDVDLAGCDTSPVALDRARAHATGLENVRFVRADVRDGLDELKARYDLVCCSLFLHHLDHADAVTLLRGMAQATDAVLLVQDLRRSRLGYALAWAALRVLTTSDVARTDGPISVRAAFTSDEARALAHEAGLDGAVVRTCWPERYTLRWSRA
jgi:2-polyprenyl-3-methyl-5-hydroxy-6-metoxy-1,4-benzoquinol methylase